MFAIMTAQRNVPGPFVLSQKMRNKGHFLRAYHIYALWSQGGEPMVNQRFSLYRINGVQL